MKKYILLLLVIFQLSFAGCGSVRSKLADSDDTILVDNNEKRTHYTIKEISEKSVVIDSICNSKKASSKKLKELDTEDPLFLSTSNYVILIHNNDGKHFYSIWLNNKYPFIYGDYIGYRILEENDLSELKKVLDKAIIP